jgi:hypothetical protein
VRRAWGLLCLACSGCTLLALSDEIHQQGCVEDIECEVLNNRNDREFDPCQIWQCDQQKKLCVFARTDRDHDGAAPPFCVDVGTRGDCDDEDSSINPGAQEICDGVDNDCDGSVDEGMLDLAHDQALHFDDDVQELDYAWNPISSELGVMYRSATDQRIGFDVLDGARGTQSGPLVFSSGEEAVRGANVVVTSSVGHFLAGLSEAGESQRLWVGDVTTAPDRSLLRLAPAMRDVGLHCAANEVCATSRPVAPSTRMRLSVRVDRVLAAYTRRSESECGSQEPQPILLNLLTESGAGAQETSSAASILDLTSDGLSPTLVPIVRDSEPFGWLAAYPNANGDLVVQQVSVLPDGALTSQRRLRLQRGEQPISHVQLALGSSDDDRITLGVAAQSGCGADAHVLFGVLQLTWDATGRSDLRVYREPRAITDETAEQPVLGYSIQYADWGVAYVNDAGLFVRVLDRNGLSVGGAGYRISEGRPSVQDYGVFPGSGGVLFRVYSYAEPRTLDLASLQACAPPP